MLQIGPDSKKIKAIKKDKDYFYITENQASMIEMSKKMGDTFIKIQDKDTGKMLYWGDPREIKEFKEDYEEIKKENLIEEEKETNNWIFNFKRNKEKKRNWSIEKMKEEGQKEKYEECKEYAKEKLETAIEKEWIGENFINQYTVAYWRKLNNCPYN